MKVEQKSYSIFLFLIAPFLSLILHSPKFKTKYFLNLLWLFFAFLGLIIITSDESKDSFRYAVWFEEFSLFSSENKAKFIKNERTLDFFRPLTFYFTSIFTSQSKFYFMVVALFYGYFYTRILGLLFSEIKVSLDFKRILILISFLFVISLTSFQFIRFSTAIVIFLYYFLKYCYNQKNIIFILFSSLSILIHFSFIFPVVFLFIFHFVPKRLELYFLLFLITSFFVVFEFSTMKVFIENNLPQQLEEKKSYLNETYQEKVFQSLDDRNWYIKYRAQIVNYTAIAFIYIFLFRKYKFHINDAQYNLLSFALFFGIFANVVAVVPSGFRFLGIVYPLFWFFLIPMLINYFEFQKNSILKGVLILVLAFNLVIGFRYLIDDLPIELFIGNFFTVLFFETTNIRLIDFLKGVF